MTFADDPQVPQDRTQFTGDSAASPAEFAPGQIIGENYEVLAWIGAGGMGNVYRVRHTIMQTKYALKTLSASKVTDSAWRRFQNEAQAIARLSHPNVVGIYNLGFHDGHLPFYVMDLLAGQSLLDRLKAKGPMDVDEALAVFIEVCAGIGYAHKKGIVHRDIKPPNIILIDDPGPNSGRVKIVDFGIAKLNGPDDGNQQQLTNAGEICGSPFYMSPEQCEGGKIDARSDIYSLGCTLYESLTGSPPFKGRSAIETLHMHQSAQPPTLAAKGGGRSFPAALERALAKMLEKAPMNRYQTMDQVREELSNIQKGQARAEQAYAEQPRTGSARRPVAGLSQKQEKGPENGPTAKSKTLIAVASATTLILAGASVWLLSVNQRKTAASLTNTTTILTDNQTVATAPIITTPKDPNYSDTTPFASLLKDASGRRQIVFNFPQEISLGEMTVDSEAKSGNTKPIVCQGKKTIEAGHRLYFFPNRTCMVHNNYFSKFGPDILHSITLPPMSDSYREVIKTALSQICQIKGLKRLDLSDCDGVSDIMLPLLDQCHALEDLALNANNISVKQLVQLKAIHKITSLTYTYRDINIAEELPKAGQYVMNMNGYRGHHGFHGHHGHQGHGAHGNDGGPDLDEMPGYKTWNQDITPLLRCLAQSPQLKTLEMPNVPLLPKDVQLISRLQNLSLIDLSNSNIVASDIDTLSRLPKLQFFHVDNCVIGTSAIPAFKKLAARSLKFIYMNSPAMSAQTLALYRQQLPGVMVNDNQ